MKLFTIIFLMSLAALVPLQAQTYYSGCSNSIAVPSPTAAAPIWAKLNVVGNVVTCYYTTGAAAPKTWIQIGAKQTVDFVNNPILVGIYLLAHNAGAVGTGTIDNVSITSPSNSIYKLADGDIGSPTLMGSANLINGVWSISGSGADIWNNTDQFNFQPWLVWGDCTITCRVTSLSAGDPWQKIGIMVRDSYNSGAAYALFCATPGKGIGFQYRLGSNNNPDVTMLIAPPVPGLTAAPSTGYEVNGPACYVLRP
jgi:hypothetical protein